MKTCETSLFYTVEDVEELLGCGETYAYSAIKKMNTQLKQKGYFTVTGRIPKAFFQEQIYGGLNQGVM